ncbi:hypothetical protein JOM56_000268 [Amanita muscaria]
MRDLPRSPPFLRPFSDLVAPLLQIVPPPDLREQCPKENVQLFNHFNQSCQLQAPGALPALALFFSAGVRRLSGIFFLFLILHHGLGFTLPLRVPDRPLCSSNSDSSKLTRPLQDATGVASAGSSHFSPRAFPVSTNAPITSQFLETPGQTLIHSGLTCHISSPSLKTAPPVPLSSSVSPKRCLPLVFPVSLTPGIPGNTHH